METRQSSVETNNSNDKLDLAKTVRIMDRLHAAEIFATPEMSKEFLDSLSFEDFIRWTNFVSGIETGTSIDERGIGSSSFIESYSNVTKATRCSYLPPFAQYRVPLFKKAFEKSQEIDDPKTAGLTLSFAINAIHPYDDGNGRTGRKFIHYCRAVILDQTKIENIIRVFCKIYQDVNQLIQIRLKLDSIKKLSTNTLKRYAAVMDIKISSQLLTCLGLIAMIMAIGLAQVMKKLNI